MDETLKAKCPGITLGCITALLGAPASPQVLIAELNNCEQSVLRLPEPRAVLESPQILTTRTAYKALGKDPALIAGRRLLGDDGEGGAGAGSGH